MNTNAILPKVLFSAAITFLSSISYSQNFLWATQTGNAGWDEGTSIKTDHDNNVYTAGFFTGTVDFDPGAGTFNLTSTGERDAFISKLNPDGQLLWVKQFGDSAFIDEKCALALDTPGNVYITGSFLGTVDFDPGSGSTLLTSQGSDRDVFIQKLDANGNFVWAKQIGGFFNSSFPTPAHCNAIAVDQTGHLYLTGYFDGTIDFDPHPVNVFNMTSQYNASDIFVCKLTTDGNFTWAKQFTGTQMNGGVGYGIAVDNNGNIYSTGTIGSSVDFDPGSATYYLTPSVSMQTEMFVSKLNASGDFVWAMAMGPGEGSAIVFDHDHAIYSSGWTPSGYPAMLNKLDSEGNLLWAKQLGGSNGKAIAVDNHGNVYTTGVCFGTNDFDPGQGVFTLTGSNSDAYISKLDSLGNFVWAGLLTGTSQVWSNDIATDLNDNIYTTGAFDGTADFDPSASVFNLSATAGNYDIFIQKLGPVKELGLSPNGLNEKLILSPNPTDGKIVVEVGDVSDHLHAVLRNIHGQTIYTTTLSPGTATELTLGRESGMYLLELTDTQNRRSVLKIIKK